VIGLLTEECDICIFQCGPAEKSALWTFFTQANEDDEDMSQVRFTQTNEEEEDMSQVRFTQTNEDDEDMSQVRFTQTNDSEEEEASYESGKKLNCAKRRRIYERRRI
jgi:hypothetical protein